MEYDAPELFLWLSENGDDDDLKDIIEDWKDGIASVEIGGGGLRGPLVLELLPRFSALIQLVIDNTCIHLDAVDAFAAMIANPTTQIKRLSFEDCHIGHAEAITLFGALHTNTVLYHFDLSNNFLDGDDENVLIALVNALMVNTTLQSLQLIGCELSDDFIHDFLRAVRPMKELRLDDNYIGEDAFDALIETVAETKTLEVLTITCGEYGHDVARLMACALDVNSSLLEFVMDAPFEYDEEEDEEDDGKVLDVAISRVTARTRIMAFLGAYAPKNRDGVPAFGFLKRDGDFAMVHRVWRFLV